ncbi:MAG: hypothetical protein R6V10_01480 [bacterium]
MSRRVFTPALLALVIFMSLYSAHSFQGGEVVFEERGLDSLSGSPLRVVFVYPAERDKLASKSAPAVIAIPPYSIPPEAMDIICTELAARGAACAIPDFFGKTEAESRQRMGEDSLRTMTQDMITIVRYLRGLPFVDPDKIGSCGHSVGGTVSILTGMADPRVRSTVPIGMESDFSQGRPQNIMFISGLYDEIHSPENLLENLTANGVTENPQNRELYGSFEHGTAVQVNILPTTDHFIETFDYFLIKDLLEWYARSFAEPGLAEGTLDHWWHKVSVFIFMLAFSVFYGVVGGRYSELLAEKAGSRVPHWLLVRLQALPLLLFVGLAWFLGDTYPGLRVGGLYLMVSLPIAQEFVSFRAAGMLRHPGTSPFRTMRALFFICLALGAATLVSFGLVSIPNYVRFPEMLGWYPVFALNMLVLFPLEVWGRSLPPMFSETISGLTPATGYVILVAVVVLVPGLVLRVADRIAQEVVIAVRARLKPLYKIEERKPVALRRRVSPIMVIILLVLFAVLGFLVYRRIAEGMLTLETAGLAGLSILRFAVLPFILTALIVRTRRFRKIAALE